MSTMSMLRPKGEEPIGTERPLLKDAPRGCARLSDGLRAPAMSASAQLPSPLQGQDTARAHMLPIRSLYCMQPQSARSLLSAALLLQQASVR